MQVVNTNNKYIKVQQLFLKKTKSQNEFCYFHKLTDHSSQTLITIHIHVTKQTVWAIIFSRHDFLSARNPFNTREMGFGNLIGKKNAKNI